MDQAANEIGESVASEIRDQYRSLWEWRRSVSDLYARVRNMANAAEAFEMWRREREALFLRHPQTPLRRGDSPPRYFAYDPTLRFHVGISASLDRTPYHLPAGGDGEVRLEPFGVTNGLRSRLGGELILYWIGGYGGGVFLPFLDATCGETTFHGGRYVLDTIKGADLGWTPEGRIILDFNFAYNPSCSYSDRWICPLAPGANRLTARVEGGERL